MGTYTDGAHYPDPRPVRSGHTSVGLPPVSVARSLTSPLFAVWQRYGHIAGRLVCHQGPASPLREYLRRVPLLACDLRVPLLVRALGPGNLSGTRSGGAIHAERWVWAS